MFKTLMVFLSLLVAAPLYALDGTALLKQIDRNLSPESFEMYRKLINIEPDGKKKEFTLFSVKKGTEKIAALFLAPASEKGRSTLRLGENMWLYIPNVGKPIRITSLQSVVGGVFNNSDILLQAAVNPVDILVISATVIIVSVVASLQPAFKASRMEPIKALRHV